MASPEAVEPKPTAAAGSTPAASTAPTPVPEPSCQKPTANKKYKPRLGAMFTFTVERTIQVRQYEPLRLTGVYVVGEDDNADRPFEFAEAFNKRVEELADSISMQQATEQYHRQQQQQQNPRAPADAGPAYSQDPGAHPSENQHKRCWAIWKNELDSVPALRPERFETVGEMDDWLRKVGKK